VCLSAANGTKIDITGMTSLQVVEKSRLVHTIVAIVLQNLTQTIIGWKDLMAMGDNLFGLARNAAARGQDSRR
jgi:hypothetical protein